jgi:hypothetical protein
MKLWRFSVTTRSSIENAQPRPNPHDFDARMFSSTIVLVSDCLSTFRGALNRERFCASPGMSGAILLVQRRRKHVDELSVFGHRIPPRTGLPLSPSLKHVDSPYLVHM